MRWSCSPFYINTLEEKQSLTAHMAHAAAADFNRVISNSSVFAGVCPVSFHCWGDGLRTGILSPGET